MRRQLRGFTLLELMMVVSVISIIAALAIPNYTQYLQRARVVEGLILAEEAKQAVSDYYAWYGSVPADNAAVALGAADTFAGAYVSAIQIDHGAIHIRFDSQYFSGTDAPLIITLRPNLLPADSGQLNPVWQCGYAAALDNTQVVGDNRTTMPRHYLPPVCQS